MTLSIRPITSADHPALWRIWQTSGWNATYRITESGFANALARSEVHLAEEDGEAVGFGRVIGDGVLYAMLYDVVVLPERRGQGIGTVIVASLIALLRSQGVRTVQLMAATGTIGFYQRFGFASRPRDRPGMSLSLTTN